MPPCLVAHLLGKLVSLGLDVLDCTGLKERQINKACSYNEGKDIPCKRQIQGENHVDLTKFP